MADDEAVLLELPAAGGPIQIDTLIGTLAQIKASGATHVYVRIEASALALRLKPETASEIAAEAADGDTDSLDFLVEWCGGGREEAERLVAEAKARKSRP